MLGKVTHPTSLNEKPDALKMALRRCLDDSLMTIRYKNSADACIHLFTTSLT